MNVKIEKQSPSPTSPRTPLSCALALLGGLLVFWTSTFLLVILGFAVYRAIGPAATEAANIATVASSTPTATATQAAQTTTSPAEGTASVTESNALVTPEITVGPPAAVLPGTPTPTLLPLPTITIEFPTPTVYTGLYSFGRQPNNSDLAKATQAPSAVSSSPAWIMMLVCGVWLFLLIGFLLAQVLNLH